MKLLKEPLLHFLLIGAALFLLFELGNQAPSAGEDNRITVTAGRIEQLANLFVRTWQRPPSPEELKGLIDDFVLEEVYCRRAMEMGIDKNDTMIRRRLRQKLEFFTDDAAALVEPSEAALEGYLAEHADQFRTDPQYTFRQLHFDPVRHGDDPVAAVRALADKLRAGSDVAGDQSLLPETFDQESSRAVDAIFGAGFAGHLDALTPGRWSDPIASGLGLHLVKLETRIPGRLPVLEEIRSRVKREWANQKRSEIRQKFNEELLKNYKVVIEWPVSETNSTPQS